MAWPEKRKRQLADDPLPDEVPSKKAKLRAFRSPSNFPPEFYDNLSTVWLTSRARRELDRRNDEHPPSKPSARLMSSHRSAKVAALGRLGVSKLALFAADGGPDLCHLRGHPEPTSIACALAPATSAISKPTQSTKPTTVTFKSKHSSAYDANFEQHLIDNNIYPPFYDYPDDRESPEPAIWDEIQQALKAPRGSLSPSTVPNSAFKDFQRRNRTKSEGIIMRNVVPLIAGSRKNTIPNEGHISFMNLDPITEYTTVNPVPNFFDGARPGDLDRKVREDLDKIIIPTEKADVPIAPNFFLEVKSSRGTIQVADGQAVLDGAYGAIIMHALQNYLQTEPLYDGNAYAFTSTFIGGCLTLYAHHITAPVAPGERPCQHTTQLNAYALTGDYDVWLEGTGAFRNLRVLAKDYRDRNTQRLQTQGADLASTIEEEQQRGTSTTEEEQQGGSSPFEFYDCQMFAEPEDDEPETQETQNANVGLAILHDEHGKDATDDTEISAGFAASFTSSITSVSREDHPRRQPKPSHSPPSPSSRRLAKKHVPRSEAGDST
ncbi:hypothetical protein ACQKWADRAFT_329002 [Trichoderma austrokoningii]